METENKLAQFFIDNLVKDEYLAWALVSYLDTKGLIDYDDFMKHFEEYRKQSIEKLQE